MKKNPKNPVFSDHEIYKEDLSVIDEFSATSATDCTGLIPSAPSNEYELNSYKEILNFSPDTINIYNRD